MSEKPLIVQSDLTLLLDVHCPDSDSARSEISPFSELVRSPEHLHTFQLSSISLWNACSAGLDARSITGTLEKWSRFDIPETVTYFINDNCSRYGIISFLPLDGSFFTISFSNDRYRRQVLALKAVQDLIAGQDDEIRVPMQHRGDLKVILIDNGFPVDDCIPLVKGLPLDISLRESESFSVRDYQLDSVKAFLGDGRPGLGYGVIVLPCGSGKTITGLAAMSEIKTSTLILAPNVAALHQWKRELLTKTTISEDDIGEYSADRKDIRKVTLCTYSMLVYRNTTDDEYHNFNAIASYPWGFVIYDEVHMLPAPVFRLSASLQSVYRLGLTATLIREDGREKEVFSLVGPKRYDVPWAELEKQGFIATAYCHEIRISLSEDAELDYALAPRSRKIVIAAKNKSKLPVIEYLLERHPGQQILIIGQYIDQLEEIQKRFSFPLITGSMSNRKREELYQDFRDGRIQVLIVSKVANYAIDLPDASVAIQVSGTFGSRQEEAQRLGRILRPKSVDSHFYTLVTRHTSEEDFSLNRQKFLIEQGYKYEIVSWD